MKTVLLAVAGISPNHDALDYALNLCRPVRAGLDILQIIRPQAHTLDLSRFKQKALRVRDMLEDAMVEAAYAEAGTPELADTLRIKAMNQVKRLIPAGNEIAVDYHCIVTGDHPDAVLKRYVDEHRSVVMAIYDKSGDKPEDKPRDKTGDRPRRAVQSGAASAQKEKRGGLLHRLSVPLVFVSRRKPRHLIRR